MTDVNFNFLHNFELTRDSYGFALRPQHRHRYKEYANIYKEEEGERSSKWRSFLAQIPISCYSKKGGKDILSTKNESNPPIHPENDGKYTMEVEQNPDQTYHSQKEEPKSLESEDFSNQYCCSEKEEKDFLEDEEKFNQPCGTVKEDKDVLVPEENSNSKKEDEACIRDTAPGKSREGIGSVSVSNDTKQSDHAKDVHCSQEKETYKVQKWVDIRPSLVAVENMLISHAKKREDIKDENFISSNDPLPSTAAEGASEEDIASESFCKEASDDCTNISGDQNVDETLHNSSSPWKELESLVQGGVPKDLRGEVWQAFLGVSKRRVKIYYEDLLAQVGDKDEIMDTEISSSVPWKWRQQIEKDIPRTFPGHPALNEAGRNSLRRLLLAYARHNPTVGYCQGMNFFAGLLLLLMPEENAFWTFVGIMDDLFEGYYTEKMIESQLDQLVFEESMRERFPRLVNHLDYLGVQVAWISGPWFLSIFVNMLPWESVLRVWDVMLFEGNRVMLFRTALALMELYGPSLSTTEDAGDAITLLQSLTGSTFDSSQLVLNACMGFLAVNEAGLQELREKHRHSVLVLVEERAKKGHVRKDSKGLVASKVYTFKHEQGSKTEERKASSTEEDKSKLESHLSRLDELLHEIMVDSEGESPPSLEDQVIGLKVELCRLLEEKRAASIRAEELETALMEMVKEDNRRELSARIEQLEQEVALLQQALADKREQESAMLQVLMKVEQEQKLTEDARRNAEHDAAAQKYAVHVLEGKYEKAMTSIAEMEKRVKVAESMLEATLQYESGQSKALSFPSFLTSTPRADNSSKRLSLSTLGLGWRDKSKGKTEESVESKSNQVSPEHNSSKKTDMGDIATA